MEEYSYTSTHPLDHAGPVTGSLYLYLSYASVQLDANSDYLAESGEMPEAFVSSLIRFITILVLELPTQTFYV